MMRMNFWNISHFISRAAYLASQVCERKVGHFSEQWRFAWCLTSSKTSNGLSRHKKKMTIRKKSIKKNFMVSNIFFSTQWAKYPKVISQLLWMCFIKKLYAFFQIQVWWKCKCWKKCIFFLPWSTYNLTFSRFNPLIILFIRSWFYALRDLIRICVQPWDS